MASIQYLVKFKIKLKKKINKVQISALIYGLSHNNDVHIFQPFYLIYTKKKNPKKTFAVTNMEPMIITYILILIFIFDFSKFLSIYTPLG